MTELLKPDEHNETSKNYLKKSEDMDEDNITEPQSIDEINADEINDADIHASENEEQKNNFEDENDQTIDDENIEDLKQDGRTGEFYYEEDRSDEINKYTKFKKVDGAAYRKVNQFLRKRTYITAREWAIARLCSDFKTPYGAEMTFIGNHLPELCPFMEEPYSPQAVNQARNAFKRKVRKSAATFFYGAMCGFFRMDELDDILFEASEIAKFLLEIEGTNLEIDEEIDIEDKISEIMRKLGESANILLSNKRGDDNDEDDEEYDDEQLDKFNPEKFDLSERF